MCLESLTDWECLLQCKHEWTFEIGLDLSDLTFQKCRRFVFQFGWKCILKFWLSSLSANVNRSFKLEMIKVMYRVKKMQKVCISVWAVHLISYIHLWDYFGITGNADRQIASSYHRKCLRPFQETFQSVRKYSKYLDQSWCCHYRLQISSSAARFLQEISPRAQVLELGRRDWIGLGLLQHVVVV